MDHSYPYATRTRHKKDADSSDNYPVFPPPNVVLHEDDANSKVFMAVARAFISVDNRAMTIKDIAERASCYGLVCQNLSAAAQAVTTYLRQHKARCDEQDDHPLLLSHTLSGTPADDDLVPALYSRSGGDSHPLSQNRLTNFRKGTAVWYLSRATGIPCPFSRAGIRLCDYVTLDPSTLHKEEPKISSRRQRLLALSAQQDKEKDDKVCGQKRKRPLRGCATKKEKESSGIDERPAKVKLTLRLKPLLAKSIPPSDTSTIGSSAQNPIDVAKQDSDFSNSADEGSLPLDSSSSSDEDDDDDDSSQSQIDKPSTKRRKEGTEAEEDEPWSLPPYPRRSISIPCYTPSVESSYYSTYALPPSKYRDPFRRSPSVPFSVATPPPESEDELDSYHVTMKMMKRISEQHGEEEEEDDLGWEADLDSEGEGETILESPGPRSPSAPLVKEEPSDVQGMLEAWEGFDSTVAERSKAEDENRTIKVEMPDLWDWDRSDAGHPWRSEDVVGIKQEDFGLFDSLLNPSASPLSPISSLSSQFSSFSWSDASSPPHEAVTDNQEEHSRDYPTIRPRARTFAQPSLTSSKSSSPFSPLPVPLVRHSLSSGSSSSSKSSVVATPSAPLPSTVLVTLLQSMSVNGAYPISTSIASAPQPCVSPLQTRCVPSPSTGTSSAEKVVVHTCQPCHPAITATHMEDIPVFQMMLGPFQLLRRIDSDFVNLSPIIAYSGTAGIPTSTAGAGDSGISERSDDGGHPSSPRSSPTVAPSSTNVVTNATVITSGSPEICGTWVTLAAAQAYVRDHLSSGENGVARRALELFLSDTLVERFPSALQDFHRLNAELRALNQFGRHFESTLMVAGGGGVGVLDCAVKISGRSEEEEGKGVAAAAAFTDGLVQCDEGGDAPLSKTEQDLFHELCDFPPDCDGGEEMMVMDSGDSANVPASEEHQDVLLPLLGAAMDVDKLPFSVAPTMPTTANPTVFGSTNGGPAPVSPPPKRSMHAKKGSISSISSLSSDSDMMALSTSTVMPKPAKVSSSALAGHRSPSVMESLKEKSDGKPLRRSKRVADLAAAQPPQSGGVQTSTRATRSRKGGSIS